MDSIKIIAELKNPANYVEYRNLCQERNIYPIPLLSYSHAMGMMLMGMHKYPDILPYEAFRKIQQEANDPIVQSADQQQPQRGQTVKAGCGTCGGGKTR